MREPYIPHRPVVLTLLRSRAIRRSAAFYTAAQASSPYGYRCSDTWTRRICRTAKMALRFSVSLSLSLVASAAAISCMEKETTRLDARLML